MFTQGPTFLLGLSVGLLVGLLAAGLLAWSQPWSQPAPSPRDQPVFVAVGPAQPGSGPVTDPDGLFTFVGEEQRDAWVNLVISQRVSNDQKRADVEENQQLQKGHGRLILYNYLYHPEVPCHFDERVGAAGEGAKWVCDPRTLLASRDCLVYSFGGGNDWDFEEGILASNPQCEIHTFDGTLVDVLEKPDKVTFHPLNLEGRRRKRSKYRSDNLPAIIAALGHKKRQIDILKVDIEGAEFRALTPLLQTGHWKKMPMVRQVLIEMHQKTLEIAALMDELLKAGYFIFHTEQNMWADATCREMSLVYLPRLREVLCQRVPCNV